MFNPAGPVSARQAFPSILRWELGTASRQPFQGMQSWSLSAVRGPGGAQHCELSLKVGIWELLPDPVAVAVACGAGNGRCGAEPWSRRGSRCLGSRGLVPQQPNEVPIAAIALRKRGEKVWRTFDRLQLIISVLSAATKQVVGSWRHRS